MTKYTADYNSKKRKVQIEDGDEIIFENSTGLNLSCCDCGLTHLLHFNLVGKPHRIEVTFFGDKRSTAQIRRWYPPKVRKAIEVLKKYKKEQEALEDAKL